MRMQRFNHRLNQNLNPKAKRALVDTRGSATRVAFFIAGLFPIADCNPFPTFALNPENSMLLQITAAPQEELSFIELLLKGGVVMIPIFLLSIAAIYVAMERYLYLRSTLSRDAQFLNKVSRSLSSGNIAEAKRYGENENSATGRIISTGLDAIGRPMREIESLMESATNIEVALMERNLGYLGIIAGVAPMLGFIGTIVGIIHIFYSISLSNNISISVISGGLYEKMITSGSGLAVGILAYLCYHLLQLRIGRFTLQIQKDVFDFMRAIQAPAK